MALDERQKRAWIREFQLNGFVVLRGFLPADFVTGMYEQLLPLLEAEHKTAVSDGWAKGRSRGRLALHLEQYIRMPIGPLRDPRFSRNPVIEELVDELLGKGRWRHGWTNVEACWKGSEYMEWHSDQNPGHGEAEDQANETVRVTFNIPLVDFNWRAGAMEVLPSTHRTPRSWGGVNEVANIYPHRLRLDLGDAVLRDGNIFHRGTPNLDPGPRPMLDQTYLKLSGNVAAPAAKT
jgi:hypothetical protein